MSTDEAMGVSPPVSLFLQGKLLRVSRGSPARDVFTVWLGVPMHLAGWEMIKDSLIVIGLLVGVSYRPVPRVGETCAIRESPGEDGA